MALLPQDVHEVDLVLGRDPADDPDAVDLLEHRVVVHRLELGAGDRLAGDPQLRGDDGARDGRVARDHADVDAGAMGLRDGGLRGRPRRVGDADEREEREALDRLEEVAGRVERGRVEVLPARGHEPQALLAHPVALGEVGIAQLRDRDLRRRPGRGRPRRA